MATPSVLKPRVEAVQTVVPTRPTDPRESLRVEAHQNLSSTRRFQIVLCYNKAREEDSGWHVAGWMKESLGGALQEQPLLAGRLRRCEGGGTDWQIVSNDSGVRLVEASAETTLADFLELKDKGEADEAELVFWEDVVEHNPQFSPLFFVQVTNFTCGGYSVGISCSLLLVDPFVLTSFLKRWAALHNSIVSTADDVLKLPLFYLPILGKPGSSHTLLNGTKFNSGKNAAQSVIFKIPNMMPNLGNIDKNLAALCIDKAEREVGAKMASEVSLFVKVPSKNEARVEICSRQGLLESPPLGKINGLTCARTSWDELGLDNVCFNEGQKPAYATSWISSVIDQGSVVIVPSTDVNPSGIRIILTFA